MSDGLLLHVLSSSSSHSHPSPILTMADNEPPGLFHAGPGTAHEVGVMVGFMAAFAIITGGYLIIWRVYNKRSEARELQRRHNLAEKTNPRNTKVMEDKDGKRGSVAYSAAPGY